MVDGVQSNRRARDADPTGRVAPRRRLAAAPAGTRRHVHSWTRWCTPRAHRHRDPAPRAVGGASRGGRHLLGSAMKITLWGTRGSQAAPGPDTVRYGGNTSCIELQTLPDTRAVLDAGTGLR